MLLAKPFYATFTPKQIADSHATSGALYALSFDSRADVDAITEAAIAAGGREAHDPEDHGFMYSRAFEDFDGHGWGPFWMVPAAAEQRSEEHTSELQSLMRISYAVFCWKKNTPTTKLQ